MPKGIFVRSPEYLAKIGKWNKGRKHTPEEKKAISDSLRGNHRRAGIPVAQELKERYSREFRKQTVEERFWSKVEKTDTCWLWTGGLWTNGYGKFLTGSRIDASRKEVLAHRLSYEWANGPIPDGFFVCHTCDTCRCVRPDHLFLGTPQENHDDMMKKGRQATTEKLKARRHQSLSR